MIKTKKITGSQAEMRDSTAALWGGFVLAMGVVYALLAIAFGSYLQPLIVMVAIPFGIVGAVIGHILLGFDLSLVSFMGVIALIMVIVSQLPDEPAKTTQAFKSVWLVAHVMAIFIGEAAFALACGVGVLYLIQENSIKTKKHRFFFKRLPSLDLLDSTGYGCIVVGFTLLTIGLITGLVYAKSVWGRFWSWDPKEVWSGISWLFYAALLHERLTVGWRGRRSAIMAIVGFGVLLFTFLGVNLFMEGHHRDFTK